MKAEEFDKIVKARTDERVDEKIQRFRENVYVACRNLFGYSDDAYHKDSWYEQYRAVLKVLSSTENKKGWPTELWTKERTRVVGELLKTFDEFTKAKLAADNAREPENTMVEKSDESDVDSLV